MSERRSLWGLRFLALGLAVLAWFYPILTAAALPGEMSFLDYAWLQGWR